MEEQLRALDLSKLHFHSYGIVAIDNTGNNKTISIFPVEKLFYENGETTVRKGDLFRDEIYQPTTLKVVEKKIKIIPEDIELREELPEEILPLVKTKYLHASWLNINNPNRYTAPNVCKGEEVIIYRYSNADKYYWDTLGFDLKLRKEDHVLDVYSDKPVIVETDGEPDEEEDLEDTYYILKSPKDKMIKIHTTDAYGELTSYDITIKTDDGYVELKDGKGNSFKLDSAADTFTVNINKDIIFNSKTMTFNNEVTTFNTTSFNIACTSYDLKSTDNTITSSATNYIGGFIKHDGISIDKIHLHRGNLGFNTTVPVN